jgi:uncharacterized protein (TIGR02118 family)
MSASPPVIVTYLYPQTTISHFDMTYYLSRHIPTCKAAWGPLGMTSVYVCDVGGKEQHYAAKTILVWKDLGSWESARDAPAAKKLVEDVRNFPDVNPVMIVGTVVG